MSGPDLSYAESRMVERLTQLYPDAEDVEETRQFMRGFVRMIVAASRGDLQPRDEYIAMVIPGVRESGVPFLDVVEGLIRTSMGAAASVEPEHVPWLIDFCADYGRRIIEAWDHE